MVQAYIAELLVDVKVILPFEMSIVVTPPPLPPLDHTLNNDQCIKVCATRNIPKGKSFNARDGIARIDQLPQFPGFNHYDIRPYFGGLDSFHDKNRICNWVRFVKHLPYYGGSEVNIVALSPMGCDTKFMATRDIMHGEQLTAFLMSPIDYKAVNQNCLSGPLPHTIEYPEPSYNDLPLDLSLSTERRLNSKKRSTPDFDFDDSDLISHSDSSRSGSPDSYVSGPPQKVRAVESRDTLNPRNIQLAKSLLISQYCPAPPRNGSESYSSSDLSDSSTGVGCRRVTKTKRREKAMLPCATCGKSFDRPSLLQRHIRTHTGEKPHVCDICRKGFSTSSSLNTHRRIHSGEKPHKCEECGKCFTASSNLYYHKMTHVKEKPHKCHQCTRSFPTPGDLRCHMFGHTGLWPFRCTVCQKGFSKVTNLRNHELLHEQKLLTPHQLSMPKMVASAS